MKKILYNYCLWYYCNMYSREGTRTIPITVASGLGYPNLKPELGCLHLRDTHTLRKGINPTIFAPAMSKY